MTFINEKKNDFAHDSSVAIAPSSSLTLGAYNSGHTATLCSAQMLGFASHSACPPALYEMAPLKNLEGPKWKEKY